MKKLSPKQREVITMMQDDWEFWAIGSALIKDTKRIDVAGRTCAKLTMLKLIELKKEPNGYLQYVLTDLGKSITL